MTFALFVLLVAALILGAVLLPWRKPEPAQPTEPDSFDVELYGRWPADHMRTKL